MDPEQELGTELKPTPMEQINVRNLLNDKKTTTLEPIN